MRRSLVLALLAAGVLLLMAGVASATVRGVYTDKHVYSLTDTAIITVHADDGDVVSVQVSKRLGPWRWVVWNSSAKTIPVDSSDGDTGYVIFSWNISAHNHGWGLYQIRVFIGGDPSTGIPTPVRTFVLVIFRRDGGLPLSISTEGGKGTAYTLDELEDMVAQGNITPQQETEINRMFETSAQGKPTETNASAELGSNTTEPQPTNKSTITPHSGGTKPKGTPAKPPQSSVQPTSPQPTHPQTPSSSEEGPFSVLLNIFRSIFGI
ncbi:MAG: hypothetical protein ACXQS9_00950 [Methermicoccaceae archaeon]